MLITLKGNNPVKQVYGFVPKPLYKDVRENIQDLLVGGWIVKSKSAYAAPVVYVFKRGSFLS